MGSEIRDIHTHADIHYSQAWIKNIEGGTVIVPPLLFVIYFYFRRNFRINVGPG